MTAATSNTAGAAGIVPAPAAGKQAAFLRGDGTWAFPTDTNTTYVFANGTDGSFTVTPRNGESQKVLIGKPATAGTADNAIQVKNSLIVTLNSGSNEGTTKFTFNGSAQKTVNITPGSIGAATSAQGTKADSALQQANIATGSANGTISVKGTDVPVKGLNSAAYVATSAFDTAGAATTALNSAKAYANGLMTWAEFE